MLYTRRELGKLVLTSLPAAAWLSRDGFAFQASKPNSTYAGVQVGLNVPYNFGTRTMSADETLAKTLQLGVSAVEMRSQPIELFLGAPMTMLDPGREKALQQAATLQLREWRLKTDPKRATALRKKYEDAGVRIQIVKYDGIYDFSDPELDYAFGLAKAVGATAISCELEVDGSRRVGQFADKHAMMVGYHGHTKTPPAMWETAFGFAKHNGANLDIGHFIAGNFGSPMAFLEKHHDRVTHVHIKDRKANEGPNVPFGQGDTPVKEVLRLIRDRKWPVQATIEFEYPVPSGSDRMAEMAKALQYCKDALLT